MYCVLHFRFEKMFCIKNSSCSVAIITGNCTLLYLEFYCINFALKAFLQFNKQNMALGIGFSLHCCTLKENLFPTSKLALFFLATSSMLYRRDWKRILVFSEYIHIIQFTRQWWDYFGNKEETFWTYFLKFPWKLEVSKPFSFLSIIGHKHSKR